MLNMIAGLIWRVLAQDRTSLFTRKIMPNSLHIGPGPECPRCKISKDLKSTKRFETGCNFWLGFFTFFENQNYQNYHWACISDWLYFKSKGHNSDPLILKYQQMTLWIIANHLLSLQNVRAIKINLFIRFVLLKPHLTMQDHIVRIIKIYCFVLTKRVIKNRSRCDCSKDNTWTS